MDLWEQVQRLHGNDYDEACRFVLMLRELVIEAAPGRAESVINHIRCARYNEALQESLGILSLDQGVVVMARLFTDTPDAGKSV